MNKTLIVLPCRYGSTRLKKKHLMKLVNGETIFSMTYKQCFKTKADKVIIATDSHEIFNLAKNEYDCEVVMTSENHQTGTDRVAEVAKHYPEYNYVLNIQGDEPLVKPQTIDQLISAIKQAENEKKVVMVTAKTNFRSIDEITQFSNVKVINDKFDNAIYFSRNIIPLDRQAILKNKALLLTNYHKHLGLYAYKRSFILEYVKFKQTPLEILESLEQLRILENGYKIKLISTKHDSIGIDEAKDFELLNKIIAKAN